MNGSLLLTYLKATVIVSVVVIVLKLLGNWFLKKYAVKWRYGVWLALAVLLLAPVQIQFPQSYVLSIPLEVSEVTEPVNRQSGFVQARTLNAAKNTKPITESDFSAFNFRPNLLTMIVAAWFVGSASFLSFYILCYLKYKRMLLRSAKKLEKTLAIQMIEQLTAELDIKKRVVPLVSSEEITPMMLGFLDAYLFLPDRDYTDFELYCILKHELLHLKRRDIWYKSFLLFARAVHWFNPIIGIMYREACKDIEMICDSLVIKGFLKDQRILYCETILSSVSTFTGMPPVLTSSFGGDKKMLKERMLNVITNQGKNGYVLAILLVVCVFIGCGLVACGVSPTQKISPHDEANNSAASTIVSDDPQQPSENSKASSTTEPKTQNATQAMSVQTAPDITLTEPGEYSTQLDAMKEWQEGLDKDNYGGFYLESDIQTNYKESQMILYMKDVQTFANSKEMAQAKASGWLFRVEPTSYSINDLKDAADKLYQQKEQFKIESVELYDPFQNRLSVYTSDNSERNLKEMQQYCGIEEIDLPNIRMFSEEPGEIHPGYYKTKGTYPDFYGRPYVYQVYIKHEGESSWSGFQLQYDSPKSDSELAEIIAPMVDEEDNNPVGRTVEWFQMELEPAW